MTYCEGYGMEKRFSIDGLDYRMVITHSGNVWFDLVGGVTRKGSANRNPCKDLFWDEPNFEDVDLDVDALRVFNVVKKFLLEYVFTKKPGRIGFCASTWRKVGIYRWVAARLARQLVSYNLVEYPEGTFSFYRQVQPALRASEGQCYVDC